MARPTQNRRSTKHRGNAAGMIEARGRTGRKPSATEKGTAASKRHQARELLRRRARTATTNRRPGRAPAIRAVVAAAIVYVVSTLLAQAHQRRHATLVLRADRAGRLHADDLLHRPATCTAARSGRRPRPLMDASTSAPSRSGQFQENCYSSAPRAAPAARPDRPRRRGRAADRGDRCARRHDRGDPADPHPLRPHRRGRGARPRDRRAGLLPDARARRARRHRRGRTARSGLGGFESYEADELLAGGEQLELAGLEIDVHLHARPQPGPPDVCAARRTRRCSSVTSCSAARSGASIFRAATGRRCLPRSRGLIDAYPPQTLVFPGHGPHTTLGAERDDATRF